MWIHHWHLRITAFSLIISLLLFLFNPFRLMHLWFVALFEQDRSCSFVLLGIVLKLHQNPFGGLMLRLFPVIFSWNCGEGLQNRVHQSPNSRCSPSSEIFKIFSVRTVRCSCYSLEMRCSRCSDCSLKISCSACPGCSDLLFVDMFGARWTLLKKTFLIEFKSISMWNKYQSHMVNEP